MSVDPNRIYSVDEIMNDTYDWAESLAEADYSQARSSEEVSDLITAEAWEAIYQYGLNNSTFTVRQYSKAGTTAHEQAIHLAHVYSILIKRWAAEDQQ